MQRQVTVTSLCWLASHVTITVTCIQSWTEPLCKDGTDMASSLCKRLQTSPCDKDPDCDNATEMSYSSDERNCPRSPVLATNTPAALSGHYGSYFSCSLFLPFQDPTQPHPHLFLSKPFTSSLSRQEVGELQKARCAVRALYRTNPGAQEYNLPLRADYLPDRANVRC